MFGCSSLVDRIDELERAVVELRRQLLERSVHDHWLARQDAVISVTLSDGSEASIVELIMAIMNHLGVEPYRVSPSIKFLPVDDGKK